MRRRHIALTCSLATMLLAGCGGGDDAATSDVTPEQRIDACLTQQPDATRDECAKWEKAGELADDGVHEDHASADG